MTYSNSTIAHVPSHSAGGYMNVIITHKIKNASPNSVIYASLQKTNLLMFNELHQCFSQIKH